MGRTALILLLTILWFIGSSWWYTCEIKQVCSTATAAIEAPIEKYGPLVFNWSNGDAITNDGFPAYYDDRMSNMGENNELHIEGHYYTGEEAPEGFENMGMARASAVKALFIDKVPEERIILSSRLLDNEPAEKDKPFASCDINWKEVAKKKVVTTANSTLIYFEFATAKEENNTEVTNYLKQVAERVTASKEKVSLTGHTDWVGSHNLNMRLGKKRANKIRNLLVKYGVPANQINVNSKGETKPISTNETDAGREKNRRVELKIN